MDRKVREAVQLNARMKVSIVRGGIDRLIELTPQIEEALAGELDKEEWAQAAITLALPLVHLGRFQELGYFLERALEVAETPESKHWAQIYLIQWYGLSGFLPKSERIWDALIQESLTPIQLIYANYFRAANFRAQGPHEISRACALTALETARQHSLPVSICMSLQGLGMLELNVGNAEAALTAFREAHALNQQQLRDPETGLRLESLVGSTLMTMRKYASAKVYLERARQLAATLEKKAYELNTWSIELTLALCLGHYDEVVRECTKLRKELWDLNAFVDEHKVLLLETLALALQAPREEAIELAEQALERIRIDGDKSSICSIEMLAHILSPGEHPLPDYVSSVAFSAEFFDLLREDSAAEVQILEASLNPLEQDLWRLFRPTEWGLWAEEGFWKVSLDGQVWVDLRRRKSTRNLLQLLHSAYPQALSSWELFEQIWPEVSVNDDRALGRLYTCVYRLGGIGLDGVVVTVGEGYSLCGPVRTVAH